MAADLIQIEPMPAVPGLCFRGFGGESDYPKMEAVILASADADQIERADTTEDIARNYAHLVNSDAYRDMIFAEVDGQVVGYARGWWMEEENGPLLYGSVGFVAPAFRRRGIGGAMLAWIEGRLRAVAAEHPAARPKFFSIFVSQGAGGLASLLEAAGYRPIRYFFDMVRPTLDDIPDFPLPEGLEVRPVLPEHIRLIWEADQEAFRDHWGYVLPTEAEYQAWMDSKAFFQPELWQVAWDTATNQVAGQVKTYIQHAENERYNRKRGWTEGISVRRPWRRRGLARALIVRSLRLQKELGMTESALGVDSENLSGATRIYEDCGFRVVRRNALYRKPL